MSEQPTAQPQNESTAMPIYDPATAPASTPADTVTVPTSTPVDTVTPPTAPPSPALASPAAPAPTPASVTPAVTAAVASVSPADPVAALSFGRAADDGSIYVRTGSGEVLVGQYLAGTPAEGLASYALKYADLRVEIDLALTRVADGRATPESATALAARVREVVATPTMVGDLATLSALADQLDAVAAARSAQIAVEKAAARAAALVRREEIVATATSLATSTAWKTTGDQFKALLDEWKTLPRADRGREQDLWKQFSAARSAFDKARRTHFAKLDAERAAAKAAKVALIEQAEALSTSTDWNATASAYRDLMAQWKSAPRGSRHDEEQWWNRFRAAQDAFFTARTTAMAARDESFKGNLVVKEALAAEAEALLPITDDTDIKAVKATLRSIQERWEKAGHVPRADKDRIEGRLRRVEEALRKHDQEQWRRTDPAARDRANGMVEQFRSSLAQLETQLAAAQSASDARKIADLTDRIASTRLLLDAAERAAGEFIR